MSEIDPNLLKVTVGARNSVGKPGSSSPGARAAKSPKGPRRSFRAMASLMGPLHEDDIEIKAKERNTAEADAKKFDPKDLKRLKISMTKMLRSLKRNEVEVMVKRVISMAKSQNNPPVLGLPHWDPKRWKTIVTIMQKPITQKEQLQKIWMECPMPMDQTEGEGFIKFLDESKDDSEVFFKKSLPFMQRLILSLPRLFRDKNHNCGLMFMKTKVEKTFTALQIAAMVACGFFCILDMEYRGFYEHGLPIDAASQFHNANMRELLEITRNASHCKYRCIINYFAQIASEKTAAKRLVTVIRYSQELPELNKSISLAALQRSKKKLVDVSFKEGKLRDALSTGILKVVSSSDFPGGHFIGEGNGPEELLVCEYPETYLMLLFIEKCAPNDVVLVIGAQHHNKVEVINNGFGLKYISPAKSVGEVCKGMPKRLATFFLLLTPQDVNYVDQYKPYIMQRELARAHIGFDIPEELFKHKVTRILTGNWGVGAHGGDLELKFALQWMAVTLARPERTIEYYAEGNTDAANLPALIAMNEKNRLVLMQAWHMLLLMSSEDPKKRCSLVKFAEKLNLILKMMQNQTPKPKPKVKRKRLRSRSRAKSRGMEPVAEE